MTTTSITTDFQDSCAWHSIGKTILSRLEKLIKSNMVSAEKVLRSFFDLEQSKHFAAWTEEDERTLAILKDLINQNPSEFFKISDIRFITQLLLDYIESLKGPLVSKHTVNSLNEIVREVNGPSNRTDSNLKSKRVVTSEADKDQSK